jgi:imidazolonepropionase-like amidohydrolase
VIGLDDLALTGATVYRSPGEEPLRDAAILIRSGKIADVGRCGLVQLPPEATVLDCRGCTITAGFWNCHVHFHERMWANVELIPAPELELQLKRLTQYGFTSVYDLSSRWENTRRLRDRVESGEVRGPRIHSTGEGLLPAGGAPSADVFRALGLMETALWEVSNAAEAQRAARELLEGAVDGVKLFVSSPSVGRLAPEVIRAAVHEAHGFGKPVFAHPNTADDILAALDGEVDIIAHTTPRSGAWNANVLQRLKSSGAALIPTLMLWKSMMRHDRLSVRQELVSTAVGQLRAWLEYDGAVLFGTDLGAVEYDPSDEYALMAEAGATFDQILASLTTSPAQRFEADVSLGEVRSGNRADLVVLNGDPWQNVRALAQTRYVLRAGEIIYAGKEFA